MHDLKSTIALATIASSMGWTQSVPVRNGKSAYERSKPKRNKSKRNMIKKGKIANRK